ncbi:FxsA family protein [Methylophaga sp. SB9B]|uniref:FxsA family protein n=1 Tax=Methylophaga sp. SB9B TaxID=2570356 RepID=UPI0010A8F78B|nr:FxsA family protein [Methylophaga sp. SB9B]THK40433.1 FxsA family protein [Methylophaga sp. SB9B]
MFKWLFLLFLLVPIAEIYVLIEVGEVIGAGWTILFVIATAVLGAWLVKLQGLVTMQRAQESIRRGETPALEMLEGMTLFISGFLLLIPGFVTDAVGFLLLVPTLRRNLLLKLIRNSNVIFRQQWSTRSRYSQSDDIIEGEVIKDDDQRHIR